MAEFSILQKGSIYFFYRAKVQHSYAHSIDDVQGFLVVIKPIEINKYIIIRIGKKRLPEEATYFCFIEKVCSSISDLKNTFSEEHQETSSNGKRDTGAAQCVGEGKYPLVEHDQHTHLYFQLENIKKENKLLKEFNLAEKGDYLISVKNPEKSSPLGAGLPTQEKAQYPADLQNNFGDYRFIPLNSPEFLNYEGAEFLIIGSNKSDIGEIIDIKKCFQNMSADELDQHFKTIENPDKNIFKVIS